MRHFQLKAVYCAPSILEQICQEPGGLDQAKDLDFAIFTGGPLAPAAGDALSKVTDLCQIYGSTETGVTPALIPLPQNWAYLEFNPYYGHVMEEVADGQYEMVLYRDMSLKWARQGKSP
jgi:acyl-coenzyme A synthetase/AMP-(fatty) acid ligase